MKGGWGMVKADMGDIMLLDIYFDYI